MKAHFLNGAPAGAQGVATRTGYMNSELFVHSYLPFFAEQTRCSTECKVLLILDNHSSHISLEAVEFCRSVGIVLLTLPPHTSHRMQPLDRTVYGPLKGYYNSALDAWQRTNPGRAVTIYDVANLSNSAFTQAMTKSNITSGFRATGIYPYNADIFTDQDFVMAEVTDEPLPSEIRDLSDTEVTSSDESAIPCAPPMPSQSTPNTSVCRVTPKEILPLPKAAKRKRSNRPVVRAGILTDTPEKDRLKAAKLQSKTKRKRKTKLVPESETESEEDLPVQLTDSESAESETESELGRDRNCDDLAIGKYVLVRYLTQQRSVKHFVGIVNTIEEDAITLNFMKRTSKISFHFAFPDEPDVDTVSASDVILVLGPPVNVSGTSRTRDSIRFGVSMDSYAVY